MWVWMIAAAMTATDVNLDGVVDSVENGPARVMQHEQLAGPSAAGVDTLRPASETLPWACGSPDCACGTGRFFACTDNSKGDVIASFDTRDYVGGTADLHFTTGIAPYETQSITFQVHVNDRPLLEWSFDGCSGIEEFVEEVSIETDVTEVRWSNLSGPANWFLIGVEDCDETSTDAYLVTRPGGTSGLAVYISGTPTSVAPGGRFPMTVDVINTGDEAATFDEAKVFVEGPISHTANAYDGANVTLDGQESVTIEKNRRVPGSTPSGDYAVEVVVYDDDTEMASDQVFVTVE